MRHWYDQAIIYQVYPRSFQDSNQDGLGDLPGLLSRLDYIKALGANTIWLNPVFTSPQVDNGYDVSNYFTIDPSFGSMTAMEQVIRRAHELGLHVILDFVLNHTSDQHPWFQDALKSSQSLFRDYYIWRTGSPQQLPNNWGSFFGGSVWQAHPQEPDTYYFHLFDRHMPDLNWRNPEVRRAMVDVAKFWVEKGIDGLRLDAFIHIAKANLAQNFPTAQTGPVLAEPMYANLPNVVTYLQEFVAPLRQLNPDLFILGEGASASPELAALYTRPYQGHALCDAIVSFRNLPKQKKANQPQIVQDLQLPVDEKLDLKVLPQTIVQWQTRLAQTTQLTLYYSNHDLPRMATAYADPHHFEHSVKTLAMMQYLQPGIPIIYYGEELGLKNSHLDRFAAFKDQQLTALTDKTPSSKKAAVLSYLSNHHKTPARQVMPWSNEPHQGFSQQTPWLKTAAEPVTVQSEQSDPDSILHFYQQLLHLKQQDLFSRGDFLLLETAPGVIAYQRQTASEQALVLTNLTAQTQVAQVAGWDHAVRKLMVGKVKSQTGAWQLEPWSSLTLQQQRLH